jgi:DNA-binding transcriptional LysR family regulator
MKIENIADLRVLIQTARRGTLTAAAEALSLTPAAASAALKRLESQLGMRLFERSTRAMRVTPQGQLLLDYAERAFDLLMEGEAQVTDTRDALIGQIRLACPSDLARTVLLPWISEFLRAHSAVELQLRVGDQPLDVVRDEVDVAIRYGTLSDSNLVARRLAVAKPVPWASPAYLHRRGTPTCPADLVQHNCIVFQRGGRPYRHWRFGKDGAWVDVDVTGDRCVDDASLAREWAVAGEGIVLKSQFEMQRDLESGALVPLLEGWETEPYPLQALLPSGRFVPQRVRTLVNFLADRFAQEFPS